MLLLPVVQVLQHGKELFLCEAGLDGLLVGLAGYVLVEADNDGAVDVDIQMAGYCGFFGLRSNTALGQVDDLNGGLQAGDVGQVFGEVLVPLVHRAGRGHRLLLVLTDGEEGDDSVAVQDHGFVGVVLGGVGELAQVPLGGVVGDGSIVQGGGEDSGFDGSQLG